MSSLLKGIGKAVKGVVSGVGKFFKKIGPAGLIIAAMVAAPMVMAAMAPAAAGTVAAGTAATGLAGAGSGGLAASMGLGSTAAAPLTGVAGAGGAIGSAGVTGISAAAAGGLGSAAGGGLAGSFGMGAMAAAAPVGLDSMASMAKIAGQFTATAPQNTASQIAQSFGSTYDSVTGGGFFSKIWEGIKTTGREIMKDPTGWIEEHPKTTEFLGNWMKNYAEAKARDEQLKNKPKYYGTYFGYTPKGDYYDTGRGEMVSHQTAPQAGQPGLMPPPSAPSAPSAAPPPPQPVAMGRGLLQQNTANAMAGGANVQPIAMQGANINNPNEVGFDYQQPGLIQSQYKVLG